MNQPTRSFTEESLASSIADIERDLAHSDANQATITEDFFVKVFLPMFAGDKLYLESEEAKRRITPERWIVLAHGPFNEVRVVDGNGAYLYSVPAYFSQKAVKPLDGTGPTANIPSVTDMLLTARQFATRGPQAMDAYMLNELQRRSFMFNKDTNNAEEVNRWNEIFKRYNRPLISTDVVSTSSATSNDKPSSTEFDPL